MVIVHGQVGIIIDFNIGNLVVIDIVLVDFFTDYEESHVVALFDHYFHLVKDEFKLLSSVHRAVGFDLDLLKDIGCL